MTGARSLGPCVVFVDADNTLWDTNGVYAEAQLALLAAVEERAEHRLSAEDRLAWLRAIDQALAERHHAGLRYPPRLLAKATALALSGHDAVTAARLAWSGGREGTRISEEDALRIEQQFLQKIRITPALRAGVRSGLERLKSAGCMILVLTEGSRSKTLALLEHHGLADLVDRVIEARKEPRLFERVMALTDNHPLAFMIGDQLDRDVEPAKAAGLATIFFPGGFRPKWHPAEADVAPDYKVSDFNAAASVVLGAIARDRRLASAGGCPEAAGMPASPLSKRRH